jgi:hypothetical protein
MSLCGVAIGGCYRHAAPTAFETQPENSLDTVDAEDVQTDDHQVAGGVTGRAERKPKVSKADAVWQQITKDLPARSVRDAIRSRIAQGTGSRGSTAAAGNDSNEAMQNVDAFFRRDSRVIGMFCINDSGHLIKVDEQATRAAKTQCTDTVANKAAVDDDAMSTDSILPCGNAVDNNERIVLAREDVVSALFQSFTDATTLACSGDRSTISAVELKSLIMDAVS